MLMRNDRTLNIYTATITPEDHVSRRSSDTYYVNETQCLRYQLLKEGLDAFIVRRDEIDRTHYPCFHQMEGVQELPVLENGERTASEQEKHTEDAVKALNIQLKFDALFGSGCDKRWVDAYFPFTHPSYELEVQYEGKWMAVLGCGIMEQQLLESAGVADRVGWAFGLAMILYGIPDIRFFSSTDSGFLSQFVLFDMSFFLPDGAAFTDMTSNVYETVRNVGGDLVEQVILNDQFTNKKNRRSQTYRIVYRSHAKALTKDEVNEVHKQIADQLSDFYGVIMRYHAMGACSAVGGGADCRVHPIPGSWFGFPAQANQAFHPSGVGELGPDLSGKDRALTCSSAGHRKSCMAKYAFKSPSRYPVEVECVAHPKRD
ncbi:unnamed protein product [Heligmosomoides polygyrus]|uniref:Phenylalanine--tRNA ligase n=1 Tax=Heligmosomoides polygyrus TaxID=6339 RepID=A0A183FMH6_HELPZ|nr:unnamed protein product [Heligmosomoides polygyrus]